MVQANVIGLWLAHKIMVCYTLLFHCIFSQEDGRGRVVGLIATKTNMSPARVCLLGLNLATNLGFSTKSVNSRIYFQTSIAPCIIKFIHGLLNINNLSN